MRRRVIVLSLSVCLSVCLSFVVCRLSVTTSLAHPVAKTLKFGHIWTSNHTGMCLNRADFAKNVSIKSYAAIVGNGER